MKMTYGKIQTNRASLKKYMAIFTKNKSGAETCLSPRPKAGQIQTYYFALMKFPEETPNFKYFSKMKTFTELSEADYKAELLGVEHVWEA